MFENCGRLFRGLRPQVFEFERVLAHSPLNGSVVALYRDGMQLYVVKQTRRELCDLETLSRLTSLNAEIMEHGFVVRVSTPLAVWEVPGHVFEVQEFYPGATLYDIVAQNKYRINGMLAGIVLSGVMHALHDLHANQIVHRDIRLQNLMLLKEQTLVVLDCTFAAAVGKPQTPIFNPPYTAPEAAAGQAREVSDSYSLAASVYHLVNGVGPPNGLPRKMKEGLGRIDFGALRAYGRGKWEAAGGRLSEPYGLMRALLNPDADERPRFKKDMSLFWSSAMRRMDDGVVLDAGPVGFLICGRLGVEIVDRARIDDVLRDLRQVSTNESVIEDIDAHLRGSPPWIVGA